VVDFVAFYEGCFKLFLKIGKHFVMTQRMKCKEKIAHEEMVNGKHPGVVRDWISPLPVSA
jgi:hypothetical protein